MNNGWTPRQNCPCNRARKRYKSGVSGFVLFVCLLSFLQLSFILFLRMVHQEHYHPDDSIYLLVSVRLSFHQIVDISMIACPNLYVPSWYNNTNLPHVSMIACPNLYLPSWNDNTKLPHVSMITCPNYISPLDTITLISPRAIPEQGNRAEVVLVVLHRWSLETFCRMYNVHCTYSGGLFMYSLANGGPFLV